MASPRRIFVLSVVIAVAGLLSVLSAQTLEPNHYWIYLTPKAVTHASPEELGISARALKRRAKVLPPNRLIDEFDFPVAEQNLQRLQAQGAKIRIVSRWLNAVSVGMSADQRETVASLPFVARIRPVRPIVLPRPAHSDASLHPLQKSSLSTTLDYGPSLTQLATEKIPDLHAMGIIGSGIVIGMIDDGFNNHRVHPALKNINVLAEFDFIHNIPDTQLQPWEDPGGATGQGNHGAGTLSSVAGFDPGNLIGGAFGASVVLAKTEMDSSGSVDFHGEEDTYVAALEWMERLGVDVASSSLAYKEFDTASYTYQNLDGKTTLVAKAARIAASKGVLLCTAMGNEGSPNVLGTLWSPADADSILAVGAASSSGVLASFSGTGPTFDTRIKPDVVAQGTNIHWVDGSASGYYPFGVQGTSCSTPLVASVAILVFSAHPEWTPMQVRQAIIQTAVQIDDGTLKTAAYPNNFYGNGLVNAVDAVLFSGPVFSNRPIVVASDSFLTVTVWLRSKSALISDSLALYYKRKLDAVFTRVSLTPSLSISHPYEFSATIPKSLLGTSPVGYFTASDAIGSRRIPYNAPDSLFSLDPTPDSILSVYPPPDISPLPTDYVLYHNYPNPFNPGTTVRFYAPRSENVELAVFNILGQRIKTLFAGTAAAGVRSQFQWSDGRDDAGKPVSSGVYFVRLKTPGSILTVKMLYMK